MNNQPQSKVCPRCRFMLSKTYSQKMICKRCGYTTNKLQIVAEEDTFNTNIKFSKRVTLKPDKVVEQQTKSEDNLQTYLKAYQAILRHLGSKFISSNIKESLQVRQKTAQTFKSLWFGYLQKMSKQGNPIAGIFTALMEKSQRKQQLKNRSTVKAQKQEQSDEGSSQGEENIKKYEQQSQRDNEQSSKRSLESQNEQSKSNRKKKSLLAKDETMREFKKIVNSLLKSIKAIKEDNPLNKFKQTCEKQLLQKLLTISRDKLQESSFASMTYLSDRYCWILGLAECFRNTKSNNKNIKNNNKNKNNTNKNKNISNKNNTKQILQKKMQMKYVRQEELRQMCRQRGLSYQKRRLFGEMSILCYDLLQYWYRKENKISVSICENARYPYGYLLQTYKQTGNKPLIIQQLIKLLETMSQQVLIKQQQVTRKLPQLSLKFITSLIYLSCVINKQTFTILQVVNFSLQQLYKYGQEYMASSEDKVRKEMIGLLIKEKNMKVKRVKKVAHKLFSYLSQYLNNIPMCLEKWCNKYSLMFKLPQHISSQLLILTTTLYNSYIQQPVSSYNCVSTVINNNNLVNNFSERFIVLQQPQILLSSLIILLKLNYGLDKSQYPYLVNIGEVWKYIEENKLNMRDRQIQKIQFVNKLLQENQYCRHLFNLNLYNKNININNKNINNNNLNINNKNITINFIDSNNGQSTISKSSPLCQSSFGLLGLVQNINKSLQQLNHINQLKYISKIQSKQLTGKISMFKSIITKKQNQQSSYLSLVYNLNLKHNNNTQNINSNNSINSNSSIVKPLMVKYVDKQQIKQRQLMIQGDGTKKSKTNTLSIKSNRLQLPQVFSDSKLITRVSLNSNLYRAIDYLQNRYNRFYINKHKLNQQNQLNRSNLIHLDRSNLMENNYTNLMENNHSKQVQKILQVQKIVEEQHQHSSSLSQSNNNNNNNKDNNNINDKNDNNINNNNNINKDDNNINNDEFVIQQYLDRAMGHYQIIYQPTINNLNQLQLKQLLTIVQSLSYSLNGQHTDCSDILQWFGYLQTVLKEYQN